MKPAPGLADAVGSASASPARRVCDHWASP
jgi:hypothetical protein